MLVHRLPWAVAVALAAGLVCGNVQATGPEADATNEPTSQVRSVATHTDYYLQKIPGTDKVRKVYYFKVLDANHSGSLERSELPGDMRLLRAYFIEADWDRNGRLSPSECWLWSNNKVPLFGLFHADMSVWKYSR